MYLLLYFKYNNYKQLLRTMLEIISISKKGSKMIFAKSIAKPFATIFYYLVILTIFILAILLSSISQHNEHQDGELALLTIGFLIILWVGYQGHTKATNDRHRIILLSLHFLVLMFILIPLLFDDLTSDMVSLINLGTIGLLASWSLLLWTIDRYSSIILLIPIIIIANDRNK